MPDTSPKVRLHQDPKTGKVTVLSKFMDNFNPIKDNKDYTNFQKNPKGFGKFFAVNLLLGDYDPSAENTGITSTDGPLTRIDFGQALSYNFHADDDFAGIQNTPQTAEGFKAGMMKIIKSREDSTKIYPEEMFQGIDFAREINDAANDIDPEKMRLAIKLSLANLKKAYGDDFLKDEDLKKAFVNRLGIDRNTELTEELIENTIVSNVTKLQSQLKKMAHKEVARLMDKAIEDKGQAAIKEINKKMPESVQRYYEEKPFDLYDLSITQDKPASLKLSPRAEIKLSHKHIALEADRIIKDLKKQHGVNFYINKKLKIYTNRGFFKPVSEAVLRTKLIADITKSQKKLKQQKKEPTKTPKVKQSQTIPEALISIQRAIKYNHLVEIEKLKEKKIEGKSPLQYTIDNKQPELAIKMVKHGFVLDEKELPKKTKDTILKHRSLIEKLFKGISKNDALRVAIAGDKENIDLSKKPSPLHLAMETGQHELAIDMIGQGMTLKGSELKKYNAQAQVKVSLRGKFIGWHTKQDKENITTHVMNKQILTQTKHR